MQNLVYKTFELNTDTEHKAKPINISGATTIRLTNIPSNVKCWISTESNGTNLYPLINRGDGWSNLPNPLYNLYIYTEGTTIDNEKIILNYTGQNDFFIYGNNSSERIDRIGAIDSFSDKSMIQLNNAINNTYSKVEPLIQGIIQGKFYYGYAKVIETLSVLPFGINGFRDKINSDDFYKISILGHLDIGADDENTTQQDGNCICEITSHLSLYNNTNNAIFTPNTTQDFDNCFSLDKNPWATRKDLFDLFGLKYQVFQHIDGGYAWALEDRGLNFGGDNCILKGEMLKKYENIGLFWNIWNNVWGQNGRYQKPSSHCSFLISISKAYSNIMG